MLLSTVFAEVLYMEKKTLSDKKSDNDVALGRDNWFQKLDTVRYHGSRYRLETFFAEEENHTRAPRWASNL